MDVKWARRLDGRTGPVRDRRDPPMPGVAPALPGSWHRDDGLCRLPGQTTIEALVALTAILTLFLAAIQFGIVLHTRAVLIGAVQDGTLVASRYDGTIADGEARARTLLGASLGPALAGQVALSGENDGFTVTMAARLDYRLAIPFGPALAIPLTASTAIEKERFHGQP
jgi:hypothetical protein